jgi:hypothetical protein
VVIEPASLKSLSGGLSDLKIRFYEFLVVFFMVYPPWAFKGLYFREWEAAMRIHPAKKRAASVEFSLRLGQCTVQ